MNKTLLNFKPYKLKLYQQIMLLIFCLMLVVVSLNTFFVNKHLEIVIDQQLDNSANMAAEAIATSPTIKGSLAKTPIDEAAILKIVKNVSQSIKASVIVLDKRENIVAIFNPTHDNLISDEALKEGNLTALQKLPANMFKNHNAKPVLDDNRQILGYVLVGFSTEKDKAINEFILNIFVMAGAIGLALGFLGALLLAYSIKRTLSGYEPIEIAHILEERNILLDTVTESIFVTDANFNVYMINSKGKALLKKAGLENMLDEKNLSFEQIGNTEALKQVLKDGQSVKNADISLNGFATVGDVIPIKRHDRIDGILLSLNEKDSVQKMAEQLSGVTNYADALRAKTHEFMNKMHVINGLVYTKNYEELKKYVTDITMDDATEVQDITSRIKDPLLASFIIAKKSRAHELLVDFTLSEESGFPEELSKKLNVHSLIIIIGNLLENSFDVLKKKENDRSILLEILTYENELVIMVSNNGEAIPKSMLAKIFQKGYTTKGKGHGYGLALLKEHLDNLHGTISVDSDELNGTEFTVEIPL
jgi:CitB family two-component system sensor histidine kinase MalK